VSTRYLSIIIPAYNSWGNVVALLNSLLKSSYKQFEVIIGDDASHTEKPKELLRLLSKRIGVSQIQIVRIPVNKGPAAARNAAAKKAKGKVLVFLDSDVTCYPDTLEKIAEKFSEDADLTALTGVWDKHQKTSNFFPQFKALRDWSYWTNERDRDGYYYLFSTRIAAIKSDVFRRLGGFNEVFRQMEDVEITYRIAKRYAIIFAPDVRVHHEFEGFLPVARKYFWRSFYWTRLYSERKKFDPVATTMWESMAGMTGAGAMASLAVGILLFFIAPYPIVKICSLVLFSMLFFVHLLLLQKFLRFVFMERGFFFMVKSLGVGILLYCVIVAGALYYKLKHI
jgi:glycosyltransferase involved in cell wall biosynthesis